MPIILDGTTGITTPGITNTGTFVFQGPVQVPAGSAATASITTAAGANTGIFFPSSSSVAITTAGTQRFVVSAAGNVGIGTATPTTVLNYTFATINGSTGAGISLFNSNSDAAWIYATSAGLSISTETASPILFKINAATRATLDASGNLGIGTSSPSQKLEVAGAAKLTGTNLAIVPSTTTSAAYLVNTNAGGNFFLGIDNSTGGSFGAGAYGRILYSGGAYPIAFFTNDTERMRLDSSGNLGLGVTPSAWSTAGNLQSNNFGSKVDGVSFANNAYFNSGWKYASNGFAGLYSQVTGQHIFYTAPSGTINNAVSLTQAMTLDASGNLSLGFTGGATRLGVRGPMYVPAAGFKELGSFFGTDSQATGNGGGITLGGVYTGTAVTSFAQVAGLKENSTDNNYAGYLAFYSRPNGDTLIERARITSNGDFSITQSPGRYTVDTTAGASSIANNGTVGFAAASGMLVVNNWTNGGVTIYLCGGGNVTVVSSVIGQVGTLAYDGGINGYIWTNNYGSTAVFGFFFVRTRSNA